MCVYHYERGRFRFCRVKSSHGRRGPGRTSPTRAERPTSRGINRGRSPEDPIRGDESESERVMPRRRRRRRHARERVVRTQNRTETRTQFFSRARTANKGAREPVAV